MNKQFADIIAPQELSVSADRLIIGKKFARTLFIANYPRYLTAGWFSPILNAPELMDISIFIHPTDTVFLGAAPCPSPDLGIIKRAILLWALRVREKRYGKHRENDYKKNTVHRFFEIVVWENSSGLTGFFARTVTESAVSSHVTVRADGSLMEKK